MKRRRLLEQVAAAAARENGDADNVAATDELVSVYSGSYLPNPRHVNVAHRSVLLATRVNKWGITFSIHFLPNKKLGHTLRVLSLSLSLS